MTAPSWTKPEPAPRNVDQQIAEVKRELAMRERAYPGFVVRSTLEKSEADEHWRRLQAALRTLLWVQRHAEALKKADLDPAKEET